MNRKKVIVIVVLAIILIAGLSFVLVYAKNQENQKRIAKELGVQIPTPIEEKLVEWQDPAGFSFSYPEGLVMDKHDEDQENYAHVEMTLKDKSGNIVVWAKDAPTTDLATWVKKEKRFLDAAVLDTTLGGENAKKILISTPKKMIVVGAFYDGMLVTVESELDDSGEWEKRHEKVVSSFIFGEKKVEGSEVPALDSSDEGGDVTINEEEVIE